MPVGDRHGGRDRRLRLCQTRPRKRRGPAPVVRTPGQGRELPGRGVPGGGDSGGQRAVGPSALLARILGGGRGASEEDPGAGRDHLPDEARDRRRAAGPEHGPLRLGDADEEYGRDGAFLDALEQAEQRYLVEVPVDTTVWTTKPMGQTPDVFVRQVRDVAAMLPERAWETIKLREGTKGPLAFDFARLRIWSVRHRRVGPPLWLVVRRSLEKDPEVKYYLSNAEPDTPIRTMAQVTGARWRVEEFFEDGKGQLGMSQYEARSWTSWHHHMSMVALAHLFVTQTRRDLGRQVPDLTLDMALRLLRAALPRPQLSVDDAAKLVEYHLAHNKKARASHRKTWLAKHLKSVQRK